MALVHDMTAASPSPLVELTDVHLTLASAAGEVNILRGVSLSVMPGERVAVVGPSGSGKSTMMMIMAGLERPTRGQVRINGTDFSRLDEDGLALFRRSNIGIVFQAFHLIQTMTALENVAVPLEFAGVGDAFAIARERLGLVGLAARVDHYPGQLSGGEQQRVALARAFAADPGLILADEPTGNLDGATGGHIVDLMFDISAKRRSTLVLITHDRELARRCDRIVRMQDGRAAVEPRLMPKAAP
jgi:putative ABC transport system ATP-binding protein